MHLHQPDSAMKHYQIVADGPDRHLALLAYERMGKWLEEADTRNDLFKDILIQKDQNDYLALKQKNKLNELQMEKDINFCCLVKIHMSLQNLSQIYCISGNSVSRRKLRLKEKLGIDKEDSLTKFLDRYN